MSINAVVLDSDNLIAIALTELLRQVVSDIKVLPINSVKELSAIHRLGKFDIDLLVSNVVVGADYGQKLMDRINGLNVTKILFYYEDHHYSLTTQKQATSAAFHLISLNASMSDWSKKIGDLLDQD